MCVFLQAARISPMTDLEFQALWTNEWGKLVDEYISAVDAHNRQARKRGAPDEC